ncbi:hypothetical protein ACHAWF_009408, partial [Thalassiosira exigua]
VIRPPFSPNFQFFRSTSQVTQNTDTDRHTHTQTMTAITTTSAPSQACPRRALATANKFSQRMPSFSCLMLLALVLAPSAMLEVDAFSSRSPVLLVRTVTVSRHNPIQSRLYARGDGFGDIDDDDDDDRDFAYARRRSGGREREEGGYYGDDRTASQSSSNQYDDNVEFFDLDDDEDDDIFDDETDFEEKYNGIIPNPLLDAMDPDGVYERLGPELFKDPIFFRDMALFAIFLALFTNDTHIYGRFDSVVEGLEKLPPDFIS